MAAAPDPFAGSQFSGGSPAAGVAPDALAGSQFSGGSTKSGAAADPFAGSEFSGGTGSSTPTLAAPKAPSKGGGGFSFLNPIRGVVGGVKNQIKAFDTDVEKAPAGIGTFVANAVEAPVAVAEKGINTGLQAAGDNSFLLGNENPALNQFARSTDWTNADQAKAALAALPAAAGLVKGVGTLGQHIQGNAEALVNSPAALLRLTGRVAGNQTAANLGNIAPTGAEKATIAAYKANPVNATLGDYGTLAAGTGAAAELAPEGSVVGDIAGTASRGAGSVATAPLLGLPEILPRALSAIGDGSLGSGLAEAAQAKQAGTELRGSMLEGRVLPEQIQRQTEAAIKGLKGSDTEIGAGMVRALGHQGLFGILDNPTNPVDQITSDNLQGASDRLRETLGKGTLTKAMTDEAQNPSANTLEAEQVFRGIAAQRQALQLQPGGYGLIPGQPGLNPDQTVPQLRQGVLDAAAQKAIDESGLKGPAAEQVGTEAAAKAANEDITALPSQYRPQVGGARSVYSDLSSIADALDKAGQDSTDMRQILAEIEPQTHIEAWQGDQQAPAYLRGNGTPAEEKPAGPQSPSSVFRQNSASKLRTGLSTDFTPEGQIGLEKQFQRDAATNRGVVAMYDKVGTTPLQTIGDQVAGADGAKIDAAMQAGDYQAIDLRANSRASVMVTDPKLIDENTTYVPKPVAEAMVRQFPKTSAEGMVPYAFQQAGKGLDILTQHAYRDALGLSPHFAVLRGVGNAFVASIKGDIPVGDLVSQMRAGAKLYGEGAANGVEAPATLSRSGLNDTNVEQDQGIGSKIARVSQAIPRAIDGMTRSAVFLSKLQDLADAKGVQISELDPSTPEYAQAVRATVQVFNGLDAMSPLERNTLARIVPMYPWVKSLAEGLLGKDGFVARNPATAALVINLGRLAAADPNAFKQNALQQEVDPLSIFSTGTSAINPIIRALVGAASGTNLSTLKPITHEGSATGPGALTLGQKAYFAANQILPSKLALSSPLAPLLTGHPFNQGEAHYQSGQLELSKGAPVPSYLPAVNTPIGKFGSYAAQVAGVPENPKPNPAGIKAHAKAVKSANKAAQTYARRIAQEHAKGNG